ncbi:hypothetical protein RA28_00285 [Ruegeria sp. ANG-S4]|nr:hypothetical protein RA28_00285 [Ruegeria sp. ANG-S4]
MKPAQISDLSAVSEAIFQKENQRLRPLLQAEARILQQLARLDNQLAEARTDSSESEGYRVTGTDVLWHRWESTTRRQLNLELARLRAQKMDAMKDLRTAFGRKQAVGELKAQLLNQARRRAE